MLSDPADDRRIQQWLSALEARHLADLRVAEVTRALRALSSAYVHRRERVARGATLDSAGKRAAFALYYGPLHFLTTLAVVRALGAATPSPSAILDIGCGTGAGAAAWAICGGSRSTISGIDRHPWAIEEARWTYRQLGLRGQARQGDAARLPPLRRNESVIAAYTLNELPPDARAHVQARLLDGAARGARILILEPIARGVTPWWDGMAGRVRAAGGRADEWRFPTTLPSVLSLFDTAAGLDHRELTARSLYLPGVDDATGTDAAV